MKRKNNHLITLSVIFCLVLISGCKKWIEVPAPSTSINSANVYETSNTAIGVLNNMYVELSGNIGSDAPNVSSMAWNAGLAGDELILVPGLTGSISLEYQNAQTSQNTQDIWSAGYPYIFQANAAIEGLTAPNNLTTAVKNQLLGEAKFLRAFYYFYLINIYGSVPLITGTDPKINASMARTSTDAVYLQIISDLKDAQGLLNKTFVDGTVVNPSQERVRPSYWAATALLSRVYLYDKQYAEAASEANQIIQNTSLFELSTLDNTFLRAGLGNKEAIWQLQPINYGQATNDAQGFIITTGFGGVQTYLSANLLNSFDKNDQRKTHWIDTATILGTLYYFPYKYKQLTATSAADVNEYSMVLRLGEQYLIYAEAQAQLGQYAEAQTYLNAIRTRAGLPNTTASDKTSLLAAIYHERQVELFTEWGHRWFDMIRAGTVNSIMGGNAEVIGGVTAQKSGSWESTDALFPLSTSVLNGNPALKQNPGY